jgi:hypothetical protein|tara:strand:- start:160 stop:426 length:267 start_codon:yes stop_codon:yes gene_type:complete
MVQTDSEILRIEKRIRGLNRITAAINDLSIYGVFYGNYPELVKVLEHAKDHVKAELKSSKERLEVLYYPNTDDSAKDVINKMYMDKGI